MFLDFFLVLRQHSLPVTLPEYLTLLEALKSEAGGASVEEFYFLSKATLVKHEQHLDLFDRLFGEYVAGKPSQPEPILAKVPPDWLKNVLLKDLSEEEKRAIVAMGGLDALWQRLRELLEQQDKRHEGGNRWIGTGGTAPFGVMGENPEGFRMSNESKENRTAVKIWEQRDYRNLDDELELNTRNMKMALRRLRILTREGLPDELDIAGTIEQTGRNGGLLNIKMQPSRQNRVKVLMLLDVGGSMDEYVELCSQLFSAARYQFKRLEFFYFHNCVYETLWRDNTRRYTRIPTWEVLHKYTKEYKMIFVGDGAMAPYEITSAKGSIEHYNEEAGIVWLNRFRQQYPHLVWLNPTLPGYWKNTSSINLLREWSEDRMFPLTLNGLTQAMKCLKNPKVKFSVD